MSQHDRSLPAWAPAAACSADSSRSTSRAEVQRLLDDTPAPAPALGQDEELRTEVRQLVVARNERRQRKGQEPLDVEAEVDRQLRELENLGQ